MNNKEELQRVQICITKDQYVKLQLLKAMKGGSMAFYIRCALKGFLRGVEKELNIT